jgi:hypothetical protein
MTYPLHGAGLGLRRDLLNALADQLPPQIGFMELAPENWIGVGGRLGKQLRFFTERYPFVCHGLSLNVGGPSPLDEAFLQRLKHFLEIHQIHYYSEHLSYCADEGHLYDLLPIPFTEEAITYVAQRIRRVQDMLERRIAIENISYYCAPGKQMEEIEFIRAVLAEADCDLLIDVNNIYVNSINHRYHAEDYLKALPRERIVYAHIAGHYKEAEDLIVDTHGQDVIDPVWQLLETAYQQFGVFPTLLERDFNIPPLPNLLAEVEKIISLQTRFKQIIPAAHVGHN